MFLQAWVDANQSLGRGMGMSEGGSAQEGEEEEEETDMLTSDAQRKPSASYQEKELREAAAAEVGLFCPPLRSVGCPQGRLVSGSSRR